MQTITIRVKFENWKIYLKKRVRQDCDMVKLWCYFSGYSVLRTQTSVAISSRRLFTPLLTVASHHVRLYSQLLPRALLAFRLWYVLESVCVVFLRL